MEVETPPAHIAPMYYEPASQEGSPLHSAWLSMSHPTGAAMTTFTLVLKWAYIRQIINV